MIVIDAVLKIDNSPSSGWRFSLFLALIWPSFLLATPNGLHTNANWKALLHMDSKGLSRVSDPNFFLSPRGASNAAAELATFRTILEKPGQFEKLSERFPARLAWLEKVSEQEFGMHPAVENAWQTFQPDKLTLVYASEHMGHAASLFGHLFLVFEKTGRSRLLSQVCNFAADLNTEEGLSPIKGLLGNLPGYLVVLPYDEKIKEYADLEHRDLWEYELDLEPDEVRQLFLHVWELQDIRFDYSFLNANCASQILHLIRVARPGVVIPELSAVAMPQDALNAVTEAGIIRERRFRPSLARQIEHHAMKAGPKARHTIQRWITSTDSAPFPAPTNSTELELAALILQARKLRMDEEDAPNLAAKYKLVLQNLAKFDLRERDFPEPRTAPEQSTLARQAGLSLVWDSGESDQLKADVDLRLGYRDLIDWPAGTQLEFLRLGLRASEDTFELERAMLLEVQTLPTYDPVFRQSTWKIRLGVERFYQEDRASELLGLVELANGVRSGPVFVQAGLSLHSNVDDTTLIGPNLSGGVLLHEFPRFRSLLEGKVAWLGGSRSQSASDLSWRNRLKPAPKRFPHLDLDTVLALRGDGEAEVRVGIRHPWGSGARAKSGLSR